MADMTGWERRTFLRWASASAALSLGSLGANELRPDPREFNGATRAALGHSASQPNDNSPSGADVSLLDHRDFAVLVGENFLVQDNECRTATLQLERVDVYARSCRDVRPSWVRQEPFTLIFRQVHSHHLSSEPQFGAIVELTHPRLGTLPIYMQPLAVPPQARLANTSENVTRDESASANREGGSRFEAVFA